MKSTNNYLHRSGTIPKIILVFMFALSSCSLTVGQNRDVTPSAQTGITLVGPTATNPGTEDMSNETPLATNISAPLESSAFNIFLLLRSNPIIQIWQYQHLYKSSTLLYENRNPEEQFPGLLENIIPDSELAIYQEFDGVYPKSEVLINRFLDGLNISVAPSGQLIAWVEETSWCPTITCYGYSRVVIYDVETKHKKFIADYNFHLPLQEDASIVIPPAIVRVIGLAWSPNERFLAVTTDFGKGIYKHLGVYDLQTQKLTEVVLGEGVSVPVWSNDSNLLAYSRASAIAGDVGYKSSIEIIKAHLDDQIDTEFNLEYDIGSFISGLNWSPDDTQIVAVASSGSLAGMNTLITVDVHSNAIHNIAVEDIPQGSFSEPKWSPNGRYIGANYRSERDGFVDQLIVFNPESGQVQAVFQADRPEASWEWTGDDSIILIEGEVSTSMQASLWNWLAGEAELQPIFLGDDSEDLINRDRAYISILGTSE